MKREETVFVKKSCLLNLLNLKNFHDIYHLKHFEVEVENQNDAISAAEYGAMIVMLDNVSPTQIKKTITALQKKKLRKSVRLEASGGINSKNINAYAKTGVDIISVGSITK